MRILQWYILRELLKAMVLTTIGMTLVFTLGGGVANMIKGVSISSLKLFQLLGFFLPVAMTLTLPVAALLSTTNIYGRLSADNEFVACRASGINIHRLLLPAAVVAVGVGGFNFYFSNFVIPRFIREIDSSLRGSVDQYVYRELQMNKFIKVQDYVLHADAVQHIHAEDKSGNKDYLRIAGAAFIELEESDATRFGTSPDAVIEFDKSARLPEVRAVLRNVSIFDRTRLEYLHLIDQPFGPIPIPLPSKMKPKWLNLPDLLRYKDAPGELPEIASRLEAIRRQIIREVCYQDIYRALTDGRDWLVGDEKVTYTIKAGCYITRSGDDGTPLFKDVTVEEESSEGRRVYQAARGSIQATRTFGRDMPSLSIALEDGVIVKHADDPILEKLKLELRSVPVPDRYARAADDLLAQLAGDPGMPLSLGQRVADAQESFNRELGEQVRVIVGIIHARTAFSLSCVVLIILGASLGIVFRGGQALTSFGLSCIPFALVVVTIIMGRQMAQNEGTDVIGLIIVWSGVGLALAADFVMLFRWLRR